MPTFWKHRVCLFSFLTFFEELFDAIYEDPFLTLSKTPANAHLKFEVPNLKDSNSQPLMILYANRQQCGNWAANLD